jgi:hypothetical protein
MKKSALAIGRKSFFISVESTGKVCIVILSLGETGVSGITAEGKSVGENLVAACREAGLSYGDITIIANKLQVSLASADGTVPMNFAFA